MEQLNVGDRVYHEADIRVTGVVIQVHSNYAYTYQVLWDDDHEYPGWYSAYLRKVEVPMSQAVWCDQGGHAFSSKDPGKRHFSETRTVDDGHRVSQVTAEMDICGPCSESSFLAQTPALTAKQDATPTNPLT